MNNQASKALIIEFVLIAGREKTADAIEKTRITTPNALHFFLSTPKSAKTPASKVSTPTDATTMAGILSASIAASADSGDHKPHKM